MEKALQTGRLRAPRMVPESTVGFRRRKAQSGRFCDDFAEVLIADLHSQLGPSLDVFRCGLQRRQLR
jgi:hypothetical protein